MRSFLRQSETLRSLVNAVRMIPSDVRKLVGVSRRSSQIRQYLATHAVRRLQIGAGPNELPGWLNADFEPRSRSTIFLDATRRFPLPDNSFDMIFSEHMIEHVPFDQGLRMLGECWRVLKVGGTIRIATPNLENVAALETNHPTPEQKRYVEWALANHVPRAGRVSAGANDGYKPAFVVNNFFWGFGHYFVYDPPALSAALEEAGFSDIRSFDPGESDVPDLRGLERHDKLIGEEFNRFETMVLQARKK